MLAPLQQGATQRASALVTPQKASAVVDGGGGMGTEGASGSGSPADGNSGDAHAEGSDNVRAISYAMRDVVHMTDAAAEICANWLAAHGLAPPPAPPPAAQSTSPSAARRLSPAQLDGLLSAYPQLRAVRLTKALVAEALQRHPNEGLRHALYRAGLVERRHGLLSGLSELVRLRTELAQLQVGRCTCNNFFVRSTWSTCVVLTPRR